MDIPDNLKALVDRLGESMVRALAQDPEVRTLAREVQEWGYDIALVMEATIALQPRSALEAEEPGAPEPEAAPWSEEDRAFLRTFRISM
ncbi:hypothetical protein [Mesoterricola sediminis]|uniref:Uncharacterized protein n=1 Tax=Mesoterricola sediminis TaxID=2927980 RepID=A0AA48KEX2_9BACT|nr:hypothetical protein [Mesoterricola sediminis]BDU78485.1 hypothetical protein METESE_34430 [Mesoterricola sediminis]